VTYGIRDGRSIKYEDFSDLYFLFPGYTEQNKIGEFFVKVDELITYHKQQFDKMVSIKKAMLEKMFPKDGEDKPEIRLAGFTDAWEQRKLSEVSDKVTEKNASRVFTETLTNSAEFGIISQRDFFDKDISNDENIDGYYIVRSDDFVYNPRISSFAPVGPIKRNKLGRNGVMSPLYYVFRPHDIEPIYLEYFFSGTVWHRFMKLNGDTGARSDRFAIKDSIFREMPLPYPSRDEQQKIGEFFDNISNLITLHQRELTKLKNMKRALLEKMFI
jgi:type I restriction enzyme S subunit